MRRTVMLIMILMLISASVGAADYEPYRIEEFPAWTVKLRRAETLFFGSLPITVGVTGLAYGTARLLGADPFSTDALRDTLTVVGIAGVLSLAVAVADYVIGEMQQ